MKFTKVRAGWYATPDGQWAAINDGLGYVSVAERDGSGVMAGITGDQWAAVFDGNGCLRDDEHAGETLDWFDTKREAVAHCEWRAAQTQR